MKILSGIILILLGLTMLSGPFVNSDEQLIMAIHNGFNTVISNYENYVQKNPIQDEFTKKDFEEEMANFQRLQENFNTTWVDNKPLIYIIVKILFGVVGLLYIINGVVVMTKSRWIAPMMGIIVAGFVTLILSFYFYMHSYINFLYDQTYEKFKISFILGTFRGSYAEAAANMRDQYLGHYDVMFIIFSVVFLIIPSIYLAKEFMVGKNNQ